MTKYWILFAIGVASFIFGAFIADSYVVQRICGVILFGACVDTIVLVSNEKEVKEDEEH